jgi:ComF family protein
MRSLLRPVQDFFHLFYPHLCLACEKNAPPYGEEICIACKATLPETNFHLHKENPFTERFWGRLNLSSGAALYLFNKESRVQHLLHNLKYKGKKEIGEILGRSYGLSLKRSPHFKDVELIVPVPLHYKKERIRGYNQSEMFAKGLSESMNIPYQKDGLKRIVYSDSQTKKSRIGRVENVQEVFEVHKPKALEGKHVLIVDDVLTTGSTLETCANKVLEVKGTKVSLVTIAIAIH